MTAKKSIVKYLPGNHWRFQREDRKVRSALRHAYGDNCWHCGHPMNFGRLQVRRKATVEHLLAKANGGTSDWDNLRLCHRGCNEHLGINTPEHKMRMRLSLALEKVPEFAARPART